MKDYTMPSKPTAGGKEKEKNDLAAEENNCATSKRSTRKIKVPKAAEEKAHCVETNKPFQISYRLRDYVTHTVYNSLD